jgi:hypothetical protein
MTSESEGNRKRLRDVVIAVLFTAVVSVAITSWWFRKQLAEARRDADIQAQIGETRANAIRAWNRLKQNWNADDDWESKVSEQNPSNSVDVEHAIAKGHPILIVGEVKGVQTNQDGGATVLVDNNPNLNHYYLHFSLAATSSVAESLLGSTHKDSFSKTDSFILVANIQNVTQDTSYQGYSLAHGTLLEEYPTRMVLFGGSGELRSEPSASHRK